MASTINAITTGVGGIVATGDTSGVIALQSAGTSIVSVSSTGMTVTGTLSSSGVSTFAAGTAAAPAITTTGDTNTGMFFPAADTIAFAEGGAESMRIDSSGNVGIGTSSPTGKLQVSGAGGVSGSTNLVYVNVTSSYGGISVNSTANNNTFVELLEAGTKVGGFNADTTNNVTSLQSDGGHALAFNTGGTTERMRLDTSGNLQFNSGYGSVATAYGCRAWVNFNGTGTIAIRGSGNVSSITDGGTGQYTVNFTTAMPDANYAVNLSSNYNDSSWNTAFIVSTATGSMSMRQAVFGGGYVDESIECVSIFR
jgi:hypothetical protein